jgi:glycosyltransferase involved in cell wall biosynthesis
MPAVSVVIPAFNAAATLDATLRSVLDQDLGDFEVIVVDDASTDDTATRADRFARLDPRVRLVRRDRNGGRPAIPRNDGIRAARGELLAFCDADDLWHPAKLSRQVAAMRRHPELGFVYAIARELRADARGTWGTGRLLPFPFTASIDLAALRRRNTIVASSVLARTALVREVGGFDEAASLRAMEDFDLWLRLAERAPFGLVPRVLVKYRVRPGSTSRAGGALDASTVKQKHRIGSFPIARADLAPRWLLSLASSVTRAALDLDDRVRTTLGSTGRVWAGVSPVGTSA